MQECRLAAEPRKPPPPGGGCDPLSKRSDRAEDGTDRKSDPRSPDTRQYVSASTGVGKSWLACALGHKACRDGFSVSYRRAPRLFAELATARGEGRLTRLMTTLERTRLLIIDDWGPEPLNAEQRRDLLEVIDDRDQKGSLLMTSQVPIARWHEIIGDPTLGDAILDRVIHRAHRIELKGESLRKRSAIVTTESLTNTKEK
jgi:hypothetical protein